MYVGREYSRVRARTSTMRAVDSSTVRARYSDISVARFSWGMMPKEGMEETRESGGSAAITRPSRSANWPGAMSSAMTSLPPMLSVTKSGSMSPSINPMPRIWGIWVRSTDSTVAPDSERLSRATSRPRVCWMAEASSAG